MNPAAAQTLTVFSEPGRVARRTLSDLFHDAAAGAPPRQPHADGELLITEAFIAQESLSRIGKLIQNETGGKFSLGPTKDIARAKAKTRERGDLALNCDFSRGRDLLSNTDQIKRAIDIFGRVGTITIGKGEKAMCVHVVDVDNTFSNPSPKKPGLRNLDIKLAVPIVLDSGERSFHICEIQFQHKGTRAVYEKSHKIYEEARSQLIRRQFIENAMDMAGCPETARNLEKRWHKTNDDYTRLMQKRERLNSAIASKLHLDELTGYQPCEFRKPKNLALQHPQGI